MPNKLELVLRKAGRELADYQVCRFWKVPEEMQQTPCDFMGFTATGRVILIEAKEVKRPGLPLGKSPGVLAHQFMALDACNRAGGLALVLWRRGELVASLSWDLVLALSEGRKSIPWDRIPSRYLRRLGGRDAHLELLDLWLPIPDESQAI